MTTGNPSQDDELDATVREARAQFVEMFASECTTIVQLIDDVAMDLGGARAQLTHRLHRMAGLGGTIGFPTVSDRARLFEDFVRDSAGRFDAAEAHRRLNALQSAFDRDVPA